MTNFNNDQPEQTENYQIFIDEDFHFNEKLLNYLYSIKNRKIIILGIKKKNNDNYVNLLDFANFNENIKSKLANNNFIPLPLLCLDGVKKQTNRFIKTHGEDSILTFLNSAKYYLSNGPELIINQLITSDEYLNNFYKIGIENWNKFSHNYNINEIYLKIIGLDSETFEIRKYIENFQKFIDSQFLNETEKIIKAESSVLKDNLTIVNNISRLFEDISNQINNFYAEI